MNTLQFYIKLFATIFILNSYGGVIGNIEKYRFAGITLGSLKAGVNKVYLRHPEFRNFDSTNIKKVQV